MKQIFLSIFIATSLLSAGEPTESTVADQQELYLTVYNNNRALVSEQRKIDLQKGVSELRYSDVASNVIPQTVIVQNDGSMAVLEQNYEFDLISNDKLLDKYVGREVKVIRENYYTGTKEEITATLLSNNGTPTFEIDGEIFLGLSEWSVVLPELPENLYARPTMNWLVNSSKSGEQSITVNYLTNGITWNADYVLNLSDDESSASLTGWVTLTNNAGTDFTNAKLKLVAGDVNTVQEKIHFPRGLQSDAMAFGASAKMQQEEFFEYHLYSYPRQVTVRNNQIKQISLLSADKISTKKEYSILTFEHGYYRSVNSIQNYPVNVDIVFETGEKNDIDMPIPAGVIRLYKNSSDGNAIFIGEDRVDHTPVNEEVSLRTGEAFDIVAEGRQVSYQNNNNREAVTTHEVTVRNHKKSDVTVNVMVPVRGDWKISDAPEYEVVTAQQIAFELSVPADGETVLTYTVTIKN